MRSVLNGAAHFHGTSLNKSLFTGRDLLQNRIHVLLRFLQHQFTVSAYIEGRFLQVGAPDCDQLSLRFLWREDPTTSVVVYQYTRHIFGAKDSPTCANYALQSTDNVTQYPEATKAVLENFYMDDYLDSVESPERALKRSKELVHLLHFRNSVFNKTLGIEHSVWGIRSHRPSGTIYCWCPIVTKGHLACQRAALVWRITKRHCWKVPRLECRTTQACQNHYTKELFCGKIWTPGTTHVWR